MADDLDRLDAELTDLGARWRAENPADYVLDETALRRERSRSLGWLATVAAAAVVIGGVVLGARALLPDDETGPAGQPTPDAVSRLDCAQPARTPVTGAPVVPEGAVAIRLCGRDRHVAGFDDAWPGDTLTGSQAEALNAALNDLKGPSDPIRGSCRKGSPYSLVLRYADGGRVWVRGGTDCGTVTVRGGGTWKDPGSITDLALQLIDEQRAGRAVPSAPIPPLCPQDWQNVATTIGVGPVAADDTVAITACQYRLEAPDGFSLVDQDAPGRLDLQAVVSNPRAILGTALRGAQADPCRGVDFQLAATQRVLIIRDVYGDIQVVPTERCWPSTLSGEQLFPSSALGDQVAALFGAP